MADYTFENHGSIWLVHPESTDASSHLEASVSTEAQWFGGSLAVEPRHVESLAGSLENDGYTVEF